MPLVAVGLSAAVILLVGGCGGDDEPDSAEVPRTSPVADQEAAPVTDQAASAESRAALEQDPCELLTRADVEQVLGTPAKGKLVIGGDASAGEPGLCEWATGEPIDIDDPKRPPINIEVTAGDEAWFEQSRTRTEASDDYEQLEGIGDAAYFGLASGGVLVGGAGITVFAGGLPIDASQHRRAVVADLLRRVAANL
jgi:hypothetical protein